MREKDSVLTSRQKKFVDEYMLDFNATQAYLRSGYKPKNSTSARNDAYALRHTPCIAVEIANRKKAMQAQYADLRERMMAELEAMAFANGSTYAKISSSGMVDFTPTSDLSADERKAISSIKQNNQGAEVKMHDKLRAMELLGRMAGLIEPNPGDKPISLADSIRQAYETRKAKEEQDAE